jgi:UDP-glucose 4-epimerase
VPAVVRQLTSPWRWDAVVHLAGVVPKDVEDWDSGRATIANHVRTALNLRLALPARWRGRVVYASSMVVYGIPTTLPVTESHARVPLHHYGLAKALSEDIWSADPGLDRWILRLPGLFSEHRRTGALFHFMRAARERKPVRVTAAQPLPWNILHVADASESILRALGSGAIDPGPVNVGYGLPIELVALAQRIAARTGAPVENVTGVVHPVFHLAIDKAAHLLNWPPTSLDARLEDLWKAFTEQALPT